jgi:hypothetical protein
VVWTGLIWLRIETSGGLLRPWEILERLSDWWLLKKGSAPWSWLVEVFIFITMKRNCSYKSQTRKNQC